MWKNLWLHYQDVPKLRRTDVKYTLHLLLRVVKTGSKRDRESRPSQPTNNSVTNRVQTPSNSVKIGFLG